MIITLANGQLYEKENTSVELFMAEFEEVRTAFRSMGKKIGSLAFNDKGQMLVLANNNAVPGLTFASIEIGAPLVLCALAKLGASVEANSLVFAESELNDEEIRFLPTVREIFGDYVKTLGDTNKEFVFIGPSL